MFRQPVAFASSFLPRVLVAAAVACATAALVTGCGGGSQSKTFVPQRIVSFGDDNSYLNSSGQKYTINSVSLDSSGNALDSASAVTTNTANMVYNCNTYPVWVQTVAANWGFDASQCAVSGYSRKAYFLANDPTTVATDASGTLNATNAATAATNAGINAVIQTIANNTSMLDSNTLVLMMAGQPDVLKAFSDYKNGGDLSTLTTSMTNLGKALSDALTSYVKGTGARIVLVRVPRISLAPLGLAQSSTDQAALLQLINAINDGMTNEAQLNFDGRQLSLVRADDLTQTLITYYSTYSITNWTDKGCASPLHNSSGSSATLGAPMCNTSYANATSSDGAVSSSASDDYLWADATHFSPKGQYRLSQLVLTNIARNPF